MALAISFALATISTAVSFVVKPATAGVSSVAGYTFFSATWIPFSWSIYSALVVWLLVSTVATVVVESLVSSPPKIFLGSTCAVLCLCIGTFVVVVGSNRNGSTDDPSDLAFQSELARTPNVYFVVTDAFGRPDLLTDELSGLGVGYVDKPPLALSVQRRLCRTNIGRSQGVL